MTQPSTTRGPWTIADFAGEWRLDRRVEQVGGTARFAGAARLERVAEGWRFEESGVWRDGPLAGARGTRSYLWQQDGAAIAVRFADDRPFHAFVPGPGEIAVRHDCAPDLYRGFYRFDLPARWRLAWRVNGPRKDYHSVTVFTRPRGACGDGAVAASTEAPIS